MTEIEPRPTVQGDRLLLKLITGHVTQQQYYRWSGGEVFFQIHPPPPIFTVPEARDPFSSVPRAAPQARESSSTMAAARVRVSQVKFFPFFLPSISFLCRAQSHSSVEGKEKPQTETGVRPARPQQQARGMSPKLREGGVRQRTYTLYAQMLPAYDKLCHGL